MTELRCKPGDLALIIKGGPIAGFMVTCIRLEDPERCARKWQGVTWLIDRTIEWNDTATGDKVPLTYIPDEYLMPIRREPDDIEEEWFTGEHRAHTEKA